MTWRDDPGHKEEGAHGDLVRTDGHQDTSQRRKEAREVSVTPETLSDQEMVIQETKSQVTMLLMLMLLHHLCWRCVLMRSGTMLASVWVWPPDTGS